MPPSRAAPTFWRSFGGHELAAGFTIREENIPAFRSRMNRCAHAAMDGNLPIPSLDVDCAVTSPGEVTLSAVEELGMLEPYGAGNPRPVFALLGATVDSLQSVGQGRHLKLRLSKGSCRFEAIYFSATAESCAVAAGMRVDAAFYLQVNTFRGQTTLQLQIIDLRPSLTPSRHEAEALELVARCCEGGPLTEREKTRIPAQPGALRRLLYRPGAAIEADRRRERPGAAAAAAPGGRERGERRLPPGGHGPAGLPGAGTGPDHPGGGRLPHPAALPPRREGGPLCLPVPPAAEKPKPQWKGVSP